MHTHTYPFADQTFFKHCINDCDTYMIDSKSSKIRKFRKRKNAKQYDFHLVQCLSRLLLLLCECVRLEFSSLLQCDERCMHVYVYLFLSLFFLVGFVFLKGITYRDEDDGDISHGFYSQRSHTFIQRIQNDGLTNNPPNNPDTWTNEREIQKTKTKTKL